MPPNIFIFSEKKQFLNYVKTVLEQGIFSELMNSICCQIDL